MANMHLEKWVSEMAALCSPDRVTWCDGSEKEKTELERQAVSFGELTPLDPAQHPRSFYHRSRENDVARTEKFTFICTRVEADAGPTNNWMAPAGAYAKLGEIFKGSMKGRTMYVVPFVMGPLGSPFSKVGVQLTDSLYVALNMRIMTRMGKVALDLLGESDAFTRCMHGKADLDEHHRFICHFPEDNAIWSVGSGYGGNALLGKKCLALRIASYLGRTEGWLAEHMLVMGIEFPDGRVEYVGAAFPSQCGKTNLAMLLPPPALKGYRIWTVGDDIAWLRVGPDGRLWAVNPEAGFFGVAPGTNWQTNPTAMETIAADAIFTNVAITDDHRVWWEGLPDPPAKATDWRGKPWTPASKEPAAHPNSRYTVPATRCPRMSPKWQDPAGVPLSAIFFGGRRAKLGPLVYETLNWKHGVFVGATMASETTAAATGAVGVVRRDPMAMLPFIGYNIGDYFAHWIEIGKRLSRPPKIFHVNWFERGPAGNFLWPGFGENLRVILWALGRAAGTAKAVDTPIGRVPAPDSLPLEGLSISKETMKLLLEVSRDEWVKEAQKIKEHLTKLGDRVPRELHEEAEALDRRLADVRH